MGTIDTIILIILGLLLFFGLYKGFVKQVFSIAAWILAIGIPFFFTKPVTKLIGDMDIIKSSNLSSFIFVGLFIITFIIVKIIGHKLGKSIQKGALGLVDRILGGAWGLAKGLIIISLALLILKGLTTLPLIGDSVLKFVNTELKLNEEGFGIGKYLYNNNLLPILINMLFS